MHFPRIRFFSSFFLKARGRHWNSREAMKMFLQNPFIFTNKFSLVTHLTQPGYTVCFYFLLNSVAFSVSFGLQTDAGSWMLAMIWFEDEPREIKSHHSSHESGRPATIVCFLSDFCLASCVMPFISSVRGKFCPRCPFSPVSFTPPPPPNYPHHQSNLSMTSSIQESCSTILSSRKLTIVSHWQLTIFSL